MGRDRDLDRQASGWWSDCDWVEQVGALSVRWQAPFDPAEMTSTLLELTRLGLKGLLGEVKSESAVAFAGVFVGENAESERRGVRAYLVARSVEAELR